MFEFGVPEEDHLALPEDLDLALQFPLAIGTLGDAAADIVSAQLGATVHRRETPNGELLFAAQVLSAFDDSKAAPEISTTLRLLAAAAFYLADAPGSSTTLIRDLEPSTFEASDFLARAVRFALHRPWESALAQVRDPRTVRIVKVLRKHFGEGTGMESLRQPLNDLRRWSYEVGSAHEVLLSDILGAVACKRIERSAWTCLPGFSGLPSTFWAAYLARPQAVKEMWPSQRMLGNAGLYVGASSVVQMPTSAGKTRATELILRAAFGSGRTRLALVVAPFRALCHELAIELQRAFQPDGVEINQLSDAMQADAGSELAQWLDLSGDVAPQVVVMTPEKLLFLLRQESRFVANVGVVIYDEGHQFDAGTRGVTYELLLTSIRRLLPINAQTVLISAVIKNSGQLADWLLKDDRKIVSDQWLQTRRLVAFASLPPGKKGQLQFNAAVEGEQEFYVPRVISKEFLRVTSREKERLFPTDESSSVALYLGLKLVQNGGVAIYSRMPASASKLARYAVTEVFKRGVSLPPPSEVSDEVELGRLAELYRRNFGTTSYLTQAAEHGIFVHHGDTPHGIRLVVEHAMREAHIRFVVCTSTLAQGVNLPIRYLLVTSPMQGRDAIKPRDFHNLIGRAGRAGMYGEGTIIFTDHRLFDTRDGEESYRWEATQALLDTGSAAATGSTLLLLCKPLSNENRGRFLANPTPLDIVVDLIDDPESAYGQFDNLSQSLVRRKYSVDDLKRQLQLRRETIEAIESFLMNYRGAQSTAEFVAASRELGRETFAHAIATEEEQKILVEAFARIAQRIDNLVPEVERQARFGKTLFGVDRAREIDDWVVSHLFELQICETVDDVLDVVWPFLDSLCVDKRFIRSFPAGVTFDLAKAWLSGHSYASMLTMLESRGAYIKQGDKRKKRFDLDATVSMCEQTFGYEFTLYLAGIRAAFFAMGGGGENAEKVVELFDLLQKRIKYGLPDATSVAYFELGFAERVVSQLVATTIPGERAATRYEAKQLVRQHRQLVDETLTDMPSFFQETCRRITT